jgi:hypothetical protein
MLLKGSCHCQAVRFEVFSHTPYPFMRCYCSICRKTAGGGGYAINIMGVASTLKVTGKRYVQIYHAKIPDEFGHLTESSGERNFCKKCASCLWMYDPSWPNLVHPFASAIDTPLPKAPQEVFIMLDFAAAWCKIPQSKRNEYYPEYPPDSIETWHKKHRLYKV